MSYIQIIETQSGRQSIINQNCKAAEAARLTAVRSKTPAETVIGIGILNREPRLVSW